MFQRARSGVTAGLLLLLFSLQGCGGGVAPPPAAQNGTQATTPATGTTLAASDVSAGGGETPDLAAVCRALNGGAICDQIDAVTTQLVTLCATQAPMGFCSTFGGNLHGIIDGCRELGGANAERICKTAEQFLFSLASACRELPGSPPELCALLSGELIAPGEVIAFEGGWTARAQALQRSLGDPVPFNDAEFPATHNSFNATTNNTPQTLSGSDPNQKYSIPDQLRMGIRAIEVDVHWVPGRAGTPATALREPMVCHGDTDHVGCTYERPLADALIELRGGWLDAHPDQVIILYIEEHLDEVLPVGGIALDDTSVSFDTTAGVIESVLGKASSRDLIFRPAEHGANCDDDAPITEPNAWINLTRAQIAAAGKQILIFTGSCGTGSAWPALVHHKKDPHYVETSEKSYAGFAYPGCTAADGAFTPLEYATKWTRFFEDSTLLSTLVNGPSTLSNADQVREMMRCGVNMPSLDQVEPSDPRLAAFVWSWAPGEPAAGDCARHGADGRFVADDCTRPLPFACANPADPRDWKIATPDGAWSAATCPAGYVFAVPRTGNHNEFLKQAKAAAHVTDVWVNYTDAAAPEDWIAGP